MIVKVEQIFDNGLKKIINLVLSKFIQYHPVIHAIE